MLQECFTQVLRCTVAMTITAQRPSYPSFVAWSLAYLWAHSKACSLDARHHLTQNGCKLSYAFRRDMQVGLQQMWCLCFGWNSCAECKFQKSEAESQLERKFFDNLVEFHVLACAMLEQRRIVVFC